MAQDPDRLLTTSEAARAIGVARGTLAKYARRGLLTPEFRLPSGQLRWRLSELRRQLAEIRVLDPDLLDPEDRSEHGEDNGLQGPDKS